MGSSVDEVGGKHEGEVNVHLDAHLNCLRSLLEQIALDGGFGGEQLPH